MFLNMFSLVFAIIPVVFSLNCSSSYAFQDSSCVFNTLNQNGTCDSFEFANCTWQECDLYFYNGKISVCIHYATKSDTNWNNCVGICCDTSVSYLPNWDAIPSCQNNINDRNSRNHKILWIVLASVTGASLLIVLVIWLCYRCKNQEVSYVAERAPQFSAQIELYNLQRQQVERAKDENSQNFMNIEWVDVPQHLQNLNECCSVCLQTGVTLQLQCGHSYHRKCIMDCVSRKRECILCRATDINKIKLYCQSCLKCYCNTTLNHHLQQLPSAAIRCLNCKKQTFTADK